MAGTSSVAVRLEGVTKVYQVGSQLVHALRGVTASIPAGARLAIVGKSGAGKSTLLHLVGMLDTPTSGFVELASQPMQRLTDEELSVRRNRLVGFVFQAAHLLPEFSALENAMMPGLIAGGDWNEVAQRAERLLAAVGLSERLRHRPGELSGGEQQRVAIARALLMAPPLLLADEPTGNLDRTTSLVVQDILLGIAEEQGVTMLLVTHDGELARRMAGRIVMEDGRIVEGLG